MLDSRVSFSFTVTVFNLESTVGLMFGEGETFRFSRRFCTSINSSKVKVILLPVKFRVESPGVAFNNTGGIESLGPPCGGTILAQPGPLIILMVIIKMRAADDIRLL